MNKTVEQFLEFFQDDRSFDKGYSCISKFSLYVHYRMVHHRYEGRL